MEKRNYAYVGVKYNVNEKKKVALGVRHPTACIGNTRIETRSLQAARVCQSNRPHAAPKKSLH